MNEVEGALPGEEFDRWRAKVGLVAGPVLAAVVGWASAGGPSPALAALMALCVTWWLSEALPPAAVALTAAVGAIVSGLATPQVAFAAFGEPLLFLFVGSFFVAEAMKVHGLGERLAAAMMQRASGRLSLLVVVSVVSFVLSTMMSNSAATAIVLPIALSAATAVARAGAGTSHRRTDERYASAMVLAVAWGASVGGVGTPVGTPPNLIGLRELRASGLDVSFLGWMGFGLPIGLILLAAMIVVLAVGFGIRRGQVLGVVASGESRPWNPGEVAVIIAMAIALFGWLTPSILEIAVPGTAVQRWVKTHVSEEVPALVAGCILFVLPGARGARPRPALTWSEATRIDWGVILMFAGGVLLGKLAKDTGLAAAWGHWLVEATGASSTWSITALVTAAAIVLSEATSNTATATLMAPLAGSLAAAANAAPIPAVLGATLGASFGFMMPISTAPNAMAYATGRIRVADMVRTGIVFDVAGFIVIVGGLRLLCPLFGWT
jgi:solute carrier family 13 (sodium-dependent dicarboxylate transporter), member 2/3/5